MKKNFTTPLLLVALVALAGYQTFANRPVAAVKNGPEPSKLVATFDLERTFNALEQKKAAFDKIPALADDLQAKVDEKRKELEQVNQDMELLVKGTPKYNQTEERLALLANEYRAYNEFCKMKIESEKGRTLKKVYLDIRKAVQELAEQNNYGLVLVDDSATEIPPGTLEDLNRQISARRVVYTSVDITDELIAYMNNKFKTAGAAPAQPKPRTATAAATPKTP